MNFIFPVLIFLSCLSYTQQSFAKSCAELKNIKGDSCATLTTEPDLSGCTDQSLLSTVKSECTGEQAKITFGSKSETHTATLKLGPEAWGKRKWVVESLETTSGGVKGGKVVAKASPAPTPVAGITPTPTPTVFPSAPAGAPSVVAAGIPSKAPYKAPEKPAATPEPGPKEKSTAKKEEPKPAPKPEKQSEKKPEAPPLLPGFDFAGYLDLYFQKNYSHQTTTNGRAFGTRNNVLQLNAAELTAKKEVNNITFRVDLSAGEMTDTLAGNSIESTKYVSQATVTYVPEKLPRLSLMAGKFYTHLGLEVTRAKDNWQYTRGYIFNYGIPLWHQGVNAAYAVVPDRLNIGLYGFNSWDGRLANEQNKSTTLGANINATLFKGLVVNYNYIGGPETADSRYYREVNEFNLTYNISSHFALATDLVFGSQRNAITATLDAARWSGYAFYGKATFGLYSLTARYEFFNDSDQGYALSAFAADPSTSTATGGKKLKISSVTVSNNFDLGDGFETRFEGRHDSADQSSPFFKNNDGTNGQFETTINAAFLYSF